MGLLPDGNVLPRKYRMNLIFLAPDRWRFIAGHVMDLIATLDERGDSVAYRI